MNTPPTGQPSLAHRRSLVRFARWLFSARTLGRIVFALVTLATLIALFYGEELWRGKRAWERSKAEMNARGRRLDFEAFIPPTVPDDQNFTMTPCLASNLDFAHEAVPARSGLPKVEEMKSRTENLAKRLGFDIGKPGRWERGERTDMLVLLGTNQEAAASQSAGAPQGLRPATQEEAAATILDILKQTCDSDLEELRTASRRPCCRFNIKYDNVPVPGILLPHLALLKHFAVKLSWRADAELALGRTNEAFNDLMLGLYVSDTIRQEPFLISHLVRIAGRAILTRVIWNGLTAHQWSEAQLQQLQALLEKDDFVKDTQRTLAGERAGAVRALEQIIARQAGLYLGDGEGGDGGKEERNLKVLRWVLPTGWLYLEMINLCRGHELSVGSFEGWEDGRLDTRGLLEALDWPANQLRDRNGIQALLHHRFFVGVFLPAFRRAYEKSLLAEVRSDLARAACALERYRLANGHYPETLAELAPRFLQKRPLDVMSGNPLLYRRESPQSYRLYSVGKNLVDDGGKTAVTKQGGINSDQGDWVWQQP